MKRWMWGWVPVVLGLVLLVYVVIVIHNTPAQPDSPNVPHNSIHYYYDSRTGICFAWPDRFYGLRLTVVECTQDVVNLSEEP